MRTVGVKSEAPKLRPWIVTCPPAVEGMLYSCVKESNGASKVKTVSKVATTPPIVSTVSRPAELPLATLQMIDVAEFHKAELHSVDPTRAELEKSPKPRFAPKMVIAVCPVCGALVTLNVEIIGESKVKTDRTVATRVFTVMPTSTAAPVPGDNKHLTVVTEVQEEVPHAVVPSCTDGVTFDKYVPKLKPDRVILDRPHDG